MDIRLQKLPIPLLEWYREHARTLPWRSDPTPYHVWLSEIMLQQTRVAAVLDYYRRFLDACPTVEDLAALPEDRLMKLWQGLGYYNRARNLQKAAQTVVGEYGGVFPRDYSAIRALPGVGDYTAGAICSIAFGLPTPAVDGNVLRVVSRITGDTDDVTTSAMKAKVAGALAQVIPRNAAGDFNQALMELGATVCLPNGAPQCEKCPAASFCAANLKGMTNQIPVKPPKKSRRVEERVVFFLFCQGKVALRRRPEKGLLAGLWEYPNELAPAAPPVSGEMQFGGTGKHIFTHIEWRMTARIVHTQSDELPPGWVWADRQALDQTYAVPNAFDTFAHLLEQNL